MNDSELRTRTLEEWRQRNRGLMLALGACLIVWILAIMLVMD